MAQVVDWLEPDGMTLTLDGWNLTNLPNAELYRLYSAYLDRHSIRRTANKYRKLYHNGEIKMPEREKPYNPKTEPLEIASRRAKASKSLGAKAIETTVITIPSEHLPYHEKLQEALDADGRVEKATFREGSHRGYIKNSDNEIEYTDDLPNKRAEFTVNFDTEPKWPLIRQVESVKLPRQESKKRPTDGKKAIILPDLQIPYHDEKAVGVALQIIKDPKPDKIILLGDPLDFEKFSNFTNIPLANEFAVSTQGAIDRLHQLMVQLRKLSPSAEIVVLEGNHDQRLTTSVIKNNMASYGLRQANAPESWPVVSVPFLCRFDDQDVEYISGYPVNRHWINENLQVKHGNKVRTGASTAKLVADDERVTTIFGHIHRLEMHHKTVDVYGGGRSNAAWSIGCLCKIDGSVPSKNSGVDLHGRPVENYENWQQAIAIVDYMDGNAPFVITPVYINTFQNYQAMYNGRYYAAAE